MLTPSFVVAVLRPEIASGAYAFAHRTAPSEQVARPPDGGDGAGDTSQVDEATAQSEPPLHSSIPGVSALEAALLLPSGQILPHVFARAASAGFRVREQRAVLLTKSQARALYTHERLRLDDDDAFCAFLESITCGLSRAVLLELPDAQSASDAVVRWHEVVGIPDPVVARQDALSASLPHDEWPLHALCGLDAVQNGIQSSATFDCAVRERALLLPTLAPSLERAVVVLLPSFTAALPEGRALLLTKLHAAGVLVSTLVDVHHLDAQHENSSMASEPNATAMLQPSWLDSWIVVHWALLIAACVMALFLAIHSLAFYQMKKRATDLVLLVIGVSDFAFVALEALKQYLAYSYLGVYDREHSRAGRKPLSTTELVLSALSRFGFFTSLYWILCLSLLIRMGSPEHLYVRRNVCVSVGLAAIYGCVFATLQALESNRVAYTMNAAVVLAMQLAVLLTIASNIRAVSATSSRMHDTNHGRTVIHRLTSYCVCAAVLTLPFVAAVVATPRHSAIGAVTEAFNYVLPIANAVLFGTGLACCQFSTSSSSSDDTNNSADLRTESLTSGAQLLATLQEMNPEGPVTKIGEGSSAVVYKTMWLGTPVALKCIRLQGAQTGVDVQQLYLTYVSDVQSEFCDEAALAAQLRHPNITLFMKLASYKGSMCLVNEYCERGSLRDVLKANPLLEWSTKVRLAFEAAKGLAFMHNREPIYLHRDIKASNILVTEDWTAKIADFGISRIANDYGAVAAKKVNRMGIQEDVSADDESTTNMSDLTTFAGTWRWSAPEVMKNPNECRFNRATDVYSFGVALWEVLTNGAVPFSDIAFDHQVRALVATGERPRFPPGALRRAPPEFVELVKACWHQKPERRPSAQDVMLTLGSLAFSVANADAASTRNMSRHAFSDNYYQALDSSRSFA